MKRLSRDTWLALGVLVLLILLTVTAALQQSRPAIAPPLSSTSSAPNGALALRLWLESQGYPTIALEESVFRVPERTRLALILEPTLTITEVEWDILDQWVEDGGTLLLAGSTFGALRAFEHYSFGYHFLAEPAQALPVQTPLLASPPLQIKVPVQTDATLEPGRQDYVTHMAVVDQPVLVSFEQGKGRVILCSAPYIFSNLGLKENGPPGLALNLTASQMGNPTPGLGIWYDEWHHGQRNFAERAVIGPDQWLRRTPAGRSLLYSFAVIFLALLLQGRRFGRPLPLPKDLSRRRPVEYITAIANLTRRAGHRKAVMRQYYLQLKRQLGRRYRLNATLADDVWVQDLARLRPDIDAQALLHLLQRMQQAKISESDMLQLAREASDWLEQAQH